MEIFFKKHIKNIILTILLVLSAVGMFFLIEDKQVLYSSFGGAFFGFLGAIFIYQIAVCFEKEQKEKNRFNNTKYIYELYIMELEMNRNHIGFISKKQKLPFFRLKTITRDKLWGELADYSKDLNLMKKLNEAYGEFELINNKIDLMNAARLANIEKSKINKSSDLRIELERQMGGVMNLGKKVLPLIAECLEILNRVKENENL